MSAVLQDELEKKILKSISVYDAYTHVTWLHKNVGERLAGTLKERKTAEYFKNALEKSGISVETYTWDSYVSFPAEAEFTIISPEKLKIEATAYAFSPSTPPEGVEGELVYVGHGGPEDYKGVDVKDKIAFVRFSFKPVYNEKIRIAESKGAKALVLMNWTRLNRRVFHYGAAKHVWGTPTRKMLEDPTPSSFTHIPAICLVRQDGEKAIELCRNQTVIVNIRTQTIREWRKVYQPTIYIDGKIEPEKFILVGGHYDAYGGGSTDNGTGNALMLELAKIFYRHKDELRRSIRFVWWTGHETAKQAGSTWYLDNFWDDINENGIVYLNCDSPGLKGTTRYAAYSYAELRNFVAEAIYDVLGKNEEIVQKRPRKWGDQSFWGIGLPSIDVRSTFPEGYEYGEFGEWYHSEEDTPDKVDISRFEKDMKIYAALILRLCNSTILPFNFVSVADEFINTLIELQDKGRGSFDVSSLIDRANNLKLGASKLYMHINELDAKRIKDSRVEKINGTLMKLSRVLSPANYGLAGRYEQDAWGDSACTKPVARLQPIAELAILDPESGTFKALKTELTREKNKVSDALIEANKLVSTCLSLF